MKKNATLMATTREQPIGGHREGEVRRGWRRERVRRGDHRRTSSKWVDWVSAG